MEEKKTKESLVREEVRVTLNEKDVLKLLRVYLKKKYDGFAIISESVNCGMGQGEGYLEDFEFVLQAEYKTKERQ